ncbi:NAD(P)-dependent dehydrogenase (short-subunit alcohol dehydrogenase family) [Sagittula marina]|uniref:NAD(P)-dependent dehydrogenase (Short-subunit alcohol dehydrogenase family) n=1 Tax=Sagittula marina TaxID=943940 RepID=A0A7W6DSN5_9RHOB|nr:SDR family oxidoreductase [Sagittula marina]MBB3985363.1 NAD(P)-dependent dehydrogenase (short-subunit alcohol dehydrogenase family) [Sagittula marina]
MTRLLSSGPSGRCALVTGAAHGIGWAIARAFAAEGLRVALADIDMEAVKSRAVELGDGHVALGVDLCVPGEARSLVDRARSALGGLDVVVNNAGMTDSSGRSLMEIEEASFERLIALNLTATAEICECALNTLPRGGSIVCLASGAAYRPLALRGAYSATKSGVVALVRDRADDAASKGISLCAIAPGYTRTPMVETLAREGRVDLDRIAASIPLGEIALPEDIAAAVLHAALDGDCLTGVTLGVDGGSALGAPSEDTAPTRGDAAKGRHDVWGDAALAQAIGKGTHSHVAAVIDATFLDSALPEAQSILGQIRSRAIRCARELPRSRDFALTIVIGAGETTDAVTLAAVDMLTRTLALEWAPAGLRVNSVIWRSPSREGLAGLCRFLGGERARLVTGQVIYSYQTAR